jgi:hypothetical protein
MEQSRDAMTAALKTVIDLFQQILKAGCEADACCACSCASLLVLRLGSCFSGEARRDIFLAVRASVVVRSAPRTHTVLLCFCRTTLSTLPTAFWAMPSL